MISSAVVQERGQALRTDILAVSGVQRRRPFARALDVQNWQVQRISTRTGLEPRLTATSASARNSRSSSRNPSPLPAYRPIGTPQTPYSSARHRRARPFAFGLAASNNRVSRRLAFRARLGCDPRRIGLAFPAPSRPVVVGWRWRYRPTANSAAEQAQRPSARS